MIAVDVADRQAQTCAAQRKGLEDKIASNSTSVAANAIAVTNLTVAMAKQTTEFTSAIDVLKVKMGLWAAVGGSLPVILVLVWQWFENK
jgi:hypothetical protein